MTEVVAVKCNLTCSQLKDAYRAGVKKSGVNVEEDVASEYEEDWIEPEIIEKLTPHGFVVEDFCEKTISEDRWRLYPESYAELWLFIAKLGNSDLKYEIDGKNTQNIHVGGYGLFIT